MMGARRQTHDVPLQHCKESSGGGAERPPWIADGNDLPPQSWRDESVSLQFPALELGTHRGLGNQRAETFYADRSPRDIAMAAANICPIISGVQYIAPSSITPHRFGCIPRVFIECTADRAIPIAMQRRMQADVPGATVMTLPTGHSPFFSAPERLAEFILAASA